MRRMRAVLSRRYHGLGPMSSLGKRAVHPTWSEESEIRAVKRFTIIDGERLRVRMPGRFSMKEILEFTRRKASSAKGEIAPEQKPGQSATMTQERDIEMARMPLLNIIRNPMCKYHVPYVPGLDEGEDESEEEGTDELDVDDNDDDDYEDDEAD